MAEIRKLVDRAIRLGWDGEPDTKLGDRNRALVLLNRITTWASIDKTGAKPQSNRRKNVNGQMLDKIQNDPECRGWTSGRWAKELKCSKPSVVDTPTWRQLMLDREKLKAERARDRRGRGTGRKKGDYGRD